MGPRPALLVAGTSGIEDAISPSAITDAEGKPCDGAATYVLHFGKEQIPPVHGFWSLTMYDERQLLKALGNRPACSG